MKIEKVQPRDIPAVKNLLYKTWKAAYGKFYTPESMKKITDNWHAPEKLLAQARDRNVYFAAAKLDNLIVGIITVRKNKDGSLFMTRIYVDPQHQGKKIGSRLMESAWKYFPRAKTMRLECEKQNKKACLFYLKNGFTPVAEIIETVEGVKMTTIEYEKSIQ